MADTITRMSLVDWLDDLTVRFLLNLPASELSSVPRLCFQVEEAQWFYEDFIRPAAAASGSPLPSLPLRQFCLQLFQHCPLLSGFTDAQHIAAYEEFLAYKVRVPVRGAILMDESMEKLVLVKGWKKSASWSFPRGKINQDEKDLDCAIREVQEETGYDVRRAGLIPEDEKDEVKYIDVTMREQHMRLFVFRGVAEDTHFEPQTRKEISKIAWYNVRDLPGFKKHKQAADQANHANKFYMVAPFLGPLKKWINLQRRKDAEQEQQEAQVAMPGNEMTDVHMTTEDEEQTDTQAEEGLDLDKSQELKKLLSIGEPAATPAQQPPTVANGQGNNLLALLQGGPRAGASQVPQTPLEQIGSFMQEPPQSPHPQHPRHPSMGFQQPVPEFPFSPQRLHQQGPPPPQQQRNFSVTTQTPFGPALGSFPNPQRQQHGFPQIPPAHVHPQQFQQFQHQHRQSMPATSFLQSGRTPSQQNGVPFAIPQRQPIQPPQLGPQMATQQMQQHMPQPSNAFLAQGSQGAIQAGPSVPKAENLPMPNLNAHSLNLLNAFKGANKPATMAAGAQGAPRQASQHQNALLDLFRKPSTPQTVPSPAAAIKAEEPSSPTLTDVTVRPPRVQERRTTMNEITRTLPAKLKAKSPSHPAVQQPHQQLPMQAAIPSETQAETAATKPQRLYDPTHPKPFVHACGEAGKPAQGAPDPQFTIMQRQPSQPTPRSPKHTGRSPKPKQASPARTSVAARGTENGMPAPAPPAFTILHRPGSSMRAQRSPAPPQQIPSSPLRHETPKPAGFQPQVLKRPESVDPATVQKAAEVVENKDGDGIGDKRDQLLALFGKTPVASPSPPTIGSPGLGTGTTPEPRAVGGERRKSDLLSLFTGASQSQPAEATSRGAGQASMAPPPPRVPSGPESQKDGLLGLLNSPQSATTPVPPPAPYIGPERKPSSQHVTHVRQQTPQNALLDLFNRPSSSSNALNSPGTPISPFTLGTPAGKTNAPPLPRPDKPALSQTTSAMSEQNLPRGRLNSMAAAAGEESGSRRGSSGRGTPTEASKGFLLDYLNGVVQKEGHRGARRG